MRCAAGEAEAGAGGSGSWAVKRPRGFVPAIARGDLEAMAAAAAALASARTQPPAAQPPQGASAPAAPRTYR